MPRRPLLRFAILLGLLASVWAAVPARAQSMAGFPGGVPLGGPLGVLAGRPASLPGGGEHGAVRSAFDHPLDPAEAPVYYAVVAGAPVHAAPDDGSQTSVRLALRDGVRVLAEEGGWSLIERDDRRGFVRSEVLSNLWMRVDKSERTLYVYRGAELVREFPADVAASDGDKVRRSALGETSQYRMPEGTFYICRKNPDSQYFRALVISYPNSDHAARGLQQGLISQAQYDAVVAAEQSFRSPPMGTALGGLIEVHGQGSGRQRAWTRGCVALRNAHMEELYDMVHVGAPIVIEP